ncbi:MAG TPA: carboxypeptidase-like regulatory domain-containing protein [Candidatus Binatia bacterium]|nr:carboxypeptidase-like regulatory domain-containing protein [Candidatus Binatia bacterium]
MLKQSFLFSAVAVLAVFACPSLFGQANGTFSGTVSDKAGAVISGATVRVTSQGTGLLRDTKTDDSGHYVVPLLPVGFFTIHVESQGFQSAEQKDIRLQVDETREVNFSLVPASVSSTVEVSATEVAVETTNPTLGQVITSEEVADLPLNGRNFVQLATLTPGTTASTNPVSFFNGAPSSEASTRGSFSLSVGGSREQETDWLLDGNDNNQLDEGGIAIFSSIDDIQEFKVLTYNYSAEYGERAGPTVLVTTKSGSNQWHGSLFEFFRNSVLDADQYFTHSQQKFNLNQFGGSFGGPIRKDKTFFFVDYQAKMQRQGVSYPGYVPSTAMVTARPNGDYDYSLDPNGVPRPGQFNYPINPTNADGFPDLKNPFLPFNPTALTCDASGNGIVPNSDGSQTGGTPCNVIPAAMVNPVGAKVIGLYPTPNAVGSIGFNYADQLTRRLNEGTWDIRLDHNFSSRDSAFVRFSYDQATNFIPGGSPTWSEATAFGSNQYIPNHGRNLALSETHVVSPNTINQFNAGFSRIFNHILSYGTGTCEAAIIGIPGANLGSKCDGITGYPASLNQATNDCEGCGMTSFSMTQYYSVGDRGYAPYQGGTNVYSVSDTLDLIRGKHEIRFGGVYRANEMNVRNNASQDGLISETGAFTGDNIGDVLVGELGVFAGHDQTFLGATVGRRWKLVRPFVQDNWRVTNNLTLNLGLAWALVTPETEVGNRQANFDVASLTWFVPKGSPGGCSPTGAILPFACTASDGRLGIQFDKTAFEPRIGLAWKPMGSQNTAVRLGYAIYHDSAWNQGGQGLWQNPPYYAEVDPPTFSYAYGHPYGSLSDGFLLGTAEPPSTLQVAGNAPCSPLTDTTVCGYVYNGPVNPDNYTGTLQSMNRNFKQGIVQQFNLNFEQQIPGNIVLTAGYAGSRSAHILVSQVNENIASPLACPGTGFTQAGYTLGCGRNLIIPQFAWSGAPFQVVNSNNSVGAARYDSLQIKAETKSTRHGIYALLGYTWARDFDSGLTDGLGTNAGAIFWPLPGTQKLDWGLSQLNLNNTFTASVLYDLPFGQGKRFGGNWNRTTNSVLGHWQVNLIERAESGFPLFVVDSANTGPTFGAAPAPGNTGDYLNYNFLSLNRPVLVGDPNRGGPEGGQTACPAQVHTLHNWLNPCAFAHAIGGELGTAPRAPAYGPRFVNTDFSIIKDFPLSVREAMNLQFRAEFFNLFNHPQFFSGGLGNTGLQDYNSLITFGVLNQQVNNPRLVQFALRLNF